MQTTERAARPVFQVLSSCLLQRKNCIKSNNQHWLNVSTERIHKIVQDHLPSGSGIDNGTKIDLERSTEEKIVFQADFHHMNENGFYDGWTEHTVIVRPSLFDKFTITVSGRNRNDIKEHIAEMFYCALRENVKEEEA